MAQHVCAKFSEYFAAFECVGELNIIGAHARVGGRCSARVRASAPPRARARPPARPPPPRARARDPESWHAASARGVTADASNLSTSRPAPTPSPAAPKKARARTVTGARLSGPGGVMDPSARESATNESSAQPRQSLTDDFPTASSCSASSLGHIARAQRRRHLRDILRLLARRIVLEADAVDAVALIRGGGEPLALERMPKVRAAVVAQDLDAPPCIARGWRAQPPRERAARIPQLEDGARGERARARARRVPSRSAISLIAPGIPA